MLRQHFRRLSIRNKLLAMVLLPLLLALPLLGAILLFWGASAFDRLLVTKIRADLAVANGYFERVLGEVGASTAAVADSHALHLALGGPDDVLQTLLRDVKQSAGLDFLNLRGNDGRLRVTDHGGDAGSGQRPRDALAPAANAAPWRPAASTSATLEVLEPATLARLAPQLSSRVPVPLVPTLNAAPTSRQTEERAMVVVATLPVRDSKGAVVGHVQGGVLLNRNLPFIDHINQIVYPEGSLPFGSRGTATLFLDDVRVSTNVRLFGPEREERAIGTRVSTAVREAVLVRGSTWLDRAFVVNDWYVSGYQPLRDSRGTAVGMLYVGFLEGPFTWFKYSVLASIGAMFLAVMAAAAFVSLRWARAIFRPIERMAATMQAVEAGRPDARVGSTGSTDEIGQLAGHLDHLLDVVDDKTQALTRWGEELDRKVVERTRELESAQVQLLRSEKLAAVGQLTASIAHEVNNPIAVIQGNLDLARELLGTDAAKVEAELKLVDEQVERMRLIVTQLLQFARPAEYAGYVENVDTARVIDDCLVLVGHELARTRIEIRREFHASGQPAINRNELQQVLVNLMVNAIHAMAEGGVLTLTTRDVTRDVTHQGAREGARAAGERGVEIEVADTGPGLGPELIGELFKPFVTRKKDGTGLGLWISRSIVERYRGNITAADRGGAVFTVSLAVESDA